MENTNNNVVSLLGKVEEKPEFSHEVFGEKFYRFNLVVERLSSAVDIIPILVSESLLEIEKLKGGESLLVEGQYRSYNEHKDGQSHLRLSVFAKEISFADWEDVNEIFLQGFICKPPIYRRTWATDREIADLLLAINRPYGKSDYIPCIAWGPDARLASGFKVGEEIRLWGRIQSREYIKKLSEENIETRTAQEVSISKLEQLK